MADQRSPRLTLLDESEQVFELPEGRTRIGRAPGNEVRLDDKTVSRFHCHLIRSGGDVRVEDAESHNSTRVNGRHAEQTALRDGDVLRVGRLKLRYQDPATQAVEKQALKRARYAASRRGGPALFPLLFFLFAVLGLAWLFIASSFTARTNVTRPVKVASNDQGLSSALMDTQRQLDMQRANLQDVKNRFQRAESSARALESDYLQKLEALRREYEDGEERSRDKAIYRQIISLEGTIRELQEQREADRRLFKKQLEDARASGPGSNVAGSGRSSRTAVSKLTPAPDLSKKDVAAIVDKLKQAVENFASIEATPETLEPELTRLSSGGDEAAGGLLAVLGHARELLKGVDDNIAFLKRRTDKLLADAGAAGGSSSEGSAKKSEGSRQMAGPEIEELQRALELSDRKITIKRAQRERLVQLIDAVKGAFGRVTDPRAVRRFLGVFARDRDVETRLAILASLRSAATLDSVPVLLGRFTTADETVRREVRKTLIAISGRDLGDNKRAWEQWWSEQRL